MKIDKCLIKEFIKKAAQNGFLKIKDHRGNNIVLDNGIFTFNGCLYKQSDGVAMGSPLGPTLANIFLCYYESLWLDQCPPRFKSIYHRRYVDDCFLLFRDKEHANLFLNYFNAKHTTRGRSVSPLFRCVSS